MSETKKNHFVPKFYLKKFLNENEKIFVYDKKIKKTSNYSSLKSIGMRENLYTVRCKISHDDILFYKKVVNPDDHKMEENFIKLLVSFLNNDLGNILSNELHEYSIEDQNKIKGFITDKINNFGFSRRQEDLFCLYENNFRPVYEDILEYEDITIINSLQQPKVSEGIFISIYMKIKICEFIIKKSVVVFNKILDKEEGKVTDIENIRQSYSDKDRKFDFIHYIMNQFLRTNKNIDLVQLKEDAQIQNTLEENNAQMNNIMFLSIHHNSLQLLDRILKAGYKTILIINDTKTTFITSDNPCINIKYDVFEYSYTPIDNDTFEIYFPLSPRIAVLLTNRECYNEKFTLKKTNDVLAFNKKIYNMAERYIYANNKEDLTKGL